MIAYSGNFPVFIVKVNPVDSEFCKSKDISHWYDWSGVFYKADVDGVVDHMNIYFPKRKNKQYKFAVFRKENVNARWNFAKFL